MTGLIGVIDLNVSVGLHGAWVTFTSLLFVTLRPRWHGDVDLFVGNFDYVGEMDNDRSSSHGVRDLVNSLVLLGQPGVRDLNGEANPHELDSTRSLRCVGPRWRG